MSFYVVRGEDGYFLTNRKATGRTYPHVYRARSGWSEDLDDAKIFSTKSAASNSANSNNEQDYEVLEVKVSLLDE